MLYQIFQGLTCVVAFYHNWMLFLFICEKFVYFLISQLIVPDSFRSLQLAHICHFLQFGIISTALLNKSLHSTSYTAAMITKVPNRNCFSPSEIVFHRLAR